MDTITHSLAGALIASATGSRYKNFQNPVPLKARLLFGGIYGAFPDIDYVTALINPLLFITSWHRGITHSLIMLPLWSLLLSGLTVLLAKRYKQWKYYFLLCALVLCSHILLDIITSWDTQILYPISDYRIGLRLAFFIDPIITLIVVIGLVCAILMRNQWFALTGIMALAVYIFMLFALSQNAKQLASNHVLMNKWEHTVVSVLPQPFSPFNWKLIISNDEGHWHSTVNLIKKKSVDRTLNQDTNFFTISAYYRPKTNLSWSFYSKLGGDNDAAIVWNHPDFYLFRKFAYFPAIHSINRSVAETCVWFIDLRFLIPNLDTPFRYGMCKSPSSTEWMLYKINLYFNSNRELIDTKHLDKEKL